MPLGLQQVEWYAKQKALLIDSSSKKYQNNVNQNY